MRAGSETIDLVFSDVAIKHLMSRCVSEHFDGDLVSILTRDDGLV